jgi:hypothetical protein
MLSEIVVAQKEEKYHRRWFEDDFFELIVWYDSNNEIYGFQLCYPRYRDERALTWNRDNGFAHEKIDDSRVFGSMPASAILVPDGIFPADIVYLEFKKRSEKIDPEVVHFILGKIQEYQK